MTTPAHSPQLPEEAKPVKRRRGMVAFYVGTGVVCLLLVGSYFAWTPLSIWYWEGEVQRSVPVFLSSGPNPKFGFPRTKAARALADQGPAAEVAFRRLLQSKDGKADMYVLRALGKPEDSWALPMLTEMAGGRDEIFAAGAIYAAQEIAGEQFFPPIPMSPDAISDVPLSAMERPTALETARSKFFKWWEREGKSRYGKSR